MQHAAQSEVLPKTVQRKNSRETYATEGFCVGQKAQFSSHGKKNPLLILSLSLAVLQCETAGK